jgi:phosphoribosyl 1,2-cyclic phosphodiesterase
VEALVRVLASGSSGNAVFVAFGETRLLVDAGVSAAALRRHLAEIGLRPEDLSAVLLTHEHGDHTSGLAGMRSRWPKVPIRATAGTARALDERDGLRLEGPFLASGDALQVGDVRIAPFTVSHDAAEAVGYRFDCGDLAVGVATDFGAPTDHVMAMLAGCRVLVLEANHDEDMLRRGPYPPYLKRRIASARGHLSNRQAAAVLAEVAGPALEHVILAHLSRTNNTPVRAVAEVSAVLDGRTPAGIEAARPFAPGAVLALSVSPATLPHLPSTVSESAAAHRTAHRQPRLFD